MPLLLAWLLVVLIWSTTPLAIKWSGEDFSALLAVALRLSLALLIGLPLVLATCRVRWSVGAWRQYGWAALSLFPAMPLLYTAAQSLPSGWIALLYAASPFFTALVDWLWNGSRLPVRKIAALLLALTGLLFIFLPALTMEHIPLWAPVAVLLSALLVSVSCVALKRVPAPLPPLLLANGALLLTVPATWLWIAASGFVWPEVVSTRAIAATVYLGVFGSLVALVLYFYLLKHLPAGSVSLITLVSPVLAVLLGCLLEDEPLTWHILIGGFLLVCGLLLLTTLQLGRWLEFYARQSSGRHPVADEINSVMDRYK